MDLEEDMNKMQEKGILNGREKIRTIVHADGIVLIAASKVGMKRMLGRFRKYIRRENT